MRGDGGLHLTVSGKNVDEVKAEAYRKGMQFFDTEQVEVIFLDAESNSAFTNASGEHTILTFKANFVVFDMRPQSQRFAS